MTPDLLSLARRAVACPRWRWMPGMLAFAMKPEQRQLDADPYGEFRLGREFNQGDWQVAGTNTPVFLVSCLPDLTDPASLGCLLALVREAWGGIVSLWPPMRADIPAWRARLLRQGALGIERTADLVGTGSTEAEALVAALEAAPERT